MRKRRIAYKGLNEGRSPYRTATAWPLPTDEGPGDWVEVSGEPVACRWGLHAVATPDEAREFGRQVYEVEMGGKLVEGEGKMVSTRMRLLRRVELPRGEPLERGTLPCSQCDKVHHRYRTSGRMSSWADPDDGHSYQRLDANRIWETRVRPVLEDAAAGVDVRDRALALLG